MEDRILLPRPLQICDQSSQDTDALSDSVHK